MQKKERKVVQSKKGWRKLLKVGPETLLKIDPQTLLKITPQLLLKIDHQTQFLFVSAHLTY